MIKHDTEYKYKHGDYIPLYSFDMPDTHYIMGHVLKPGVFPILRSALYKFIGLDAADIDSMVWNTPEYIYGEWFDDPEATTIGCDHTLREHTEPGVGRFLLTKITENVVSND